MNFFQKLIAVWQKVNIVQRALTKLSGLKIELIGPSHGIIWRSQPGHIVDAYARWARGETRTKAVVIYDTMWDSTRKMAHAIVEGIGLEGVDAKLHNLSSTHRSDVMTDVLDARALVFGSPTLNNTMFPTLGDFLYYLGGLKPRAQVAAAFGSFGWGGGAVKAMRKEIEAMGLPLLDEGLEVRYVPDEEALARCVAYGRQIASRVK